MANGRQMLGQVLATRPGNFLELLPADLRQYAAPGVDSPAVVIELKFTTEWETGIVDARGPWRSRFGTIWAKPDEPVMVQQKEKGPHGKHRRKY